MSCERIERTAGQLDTVPRSQRSNDSRFGTSPPAPRVRQPRRRHRRGRDLPPVEQPVLRALRAVAGAADRFYTYADPRDRTFVGDWDGDGVTEIGLSRESAGFFYLCNTLTTGVADDEFFFGDPDDRFVAGDSGVIDGRDAPAVFGARTCCARWPLTS